MEKNTNTLEETVRAMGDGTAYIEGVDYSDRKDCNYICKLYRVLKR